MKSIYYLIAGFFLLISQVAQAQNPTIHYSDYFASTGVFNATSLTISSVQLSGSNRGLAVCVFESATTTISGITFNTTENLTQVESLSDSNRDIEFWYLSNPTATTADVVITLSGAGGSTAIMGTAIGLSNVKQAQPTLSGSANCSSCLVETVDLSTTVANTMLLSCVNHSTQVATFSHGDGQTELSDFGESGGGGWRKASSHELKGISGLETLESTASTSGTMLMLGIGVEPVAVAVTPRRRRSVSFR